MEFNAPEAQKVTNRINQYANSIVTTYMLIGFIVMGSAGLVAVAVVVGALGFEGNLFAGGFGGLISAVIGGALGRDFGEQRAMMIRHAAHSLAALIQIEANTRR